jgi:hypothetical protein
VACLRRVGRLRFLNRRKDVPGPLWLVVSKEMEINGIWGRPIYNVVGSDRILPTVLYLIRDGFPRRPSQTVEVAVG